MSHSDVLGTSRELNGIISLAESVRTQADSSHFRSIKIVSRFIESIVIKGIVGNQSLTEVIAVGVCLKCIGGISKGYVVLIFDVVRQLKCVICIVIQGA